MPIVEIAGIPSGICDDSLEREAMLLRFECAIQEVVASISELRVEPEQTTLFFHADLRQRGMGREIMVKVTGLFKFDERKFSVRQKLADELARTVHGHLSPHLDQLVLIEVLVPIFDQACSGFGRWYEEDGFGRKDGLGDSED